MKRSTERTLFGSALALCLGLLIAVYAQARQPRPPAEDRSRWQSLAAELGLNAEQERQLEASRVALRTRLEASRRAIGGEQRALLAQLQSDSPDRTAVAGHLQRIADLQRDTMAGIIDHQLETMNFLTPDQRQVYRRQVLPKVMPTGRGDGFGRPGGPRHSGGGPDRGRGGPPRDQPGQGRPRTPDGPADR